MTIYYSDTVGHIEVPVILHCDNCSYSMTWWLPWPNGIDPMTLTDWTVVVTVEGIDTIHLLFLLLYSDWRILSYSIIDQYSEGLTHYIVIITIIDASRLKILMNYEDTDSFIDMTVFRQYSIIIILPVTLLLIVPVGRWRWLLFNEWDPLTDEMVWRYYITDCETVFNSISVLICLAYTWPYIVQ